MNTTGRYFRPIGSTQMLHHPRSKTRACLKITQCHGTDLLFSCLVLYMITFCGMAKIWQQIKVLLNMPFRAAQQYFYVDKIGCVESMGWGHVTSFDYRIWMFLTPISLPVWSCTNAVPLFGCTVAVSFDSSWLNQQ